MSDQLKMLAQLHKAGILSDEEYAAKVALVTGGGAAAIGEGSTAVGQNATFIKGNVTGNVTINPLPSPTDPGQKTAVRYLRRLLAQCNQLPIAALGGHEGDGQELRLENVYINLNTTTPVPLPESKRTAREKERLVTAREAADTHSRLVLLGDPGGGKSSFLYHLTIEKVSRYLAEPDASHPLPLLIRLRDLAPNLANLPRPANAQAQQTQLLQAVDAFWRQEGGEEGAAFVAYLHEQLHAGQASLFLDGFDEVAEALRPLVKQTVLALLNQYHQLPQLILTSRLRSWRADIFPAFKTYTIAPLNDEQIRTFVNSWYQAQTQPPIERFTAEQAQQRINDFQKAVAETDLQKLAQNPMLLTTMALVHQRETKLPREKVRLYDEAVEVLMQRWQGQQKGWELSPELQTWLTEAHHWRPALERLAYECHQAQAGLTTQQSQTEKPTAAGDLAEMEIIAILRQPDYLGSLALVEQFLAYVDYRAGLLVGRGGDAEGQQPAFYSFPHRTFQEYLAGCYLMRNPSQAAKQVWKRADEGDFWAVAVQLGAEELLYNRRFKDTVQDLAYRLHGRGQFQSPGDWRRLLWSGQLALLLGAENIRRDTESMGRTVYGPAYLDQLQANLGQLLSQPAILSLVERAEAGRVLGLLGDPREGVRLKNGLPDIAWGKELPAGTYTIGSRERSNNPVREVIILQPYCLARYPITQAQFAAFEQAQDWDDKRWWQGLPKNEKQFEPSRFSYANHPRENVSWYQAVAFCRWLSAKLAPTGYEISLPTEAEWEAAARYPHGQAYPWGEAWDSANANTSEGGINSTTAVGSYPQGTNTALELYDMSGNVFEWCLNKYKHPHHTAIDKSNDNRVARGGSWIFNRDYARAAFRVNGGALNRGLSIGFRPLLRRAPSL